MTAVSYIHGLPNRPPDEWADRARNTQGPNVRWRPGLYTVGENRLMLMADQASLLANFYPDDRQAAIDLRAITEALEAGLHTKSYQLPQGTSPRLAQYIRAAARLNMPEGMPKGLGGGVLIPYEDCQAFMTQTVDPYSQSGEVIYSENASSIDCRDRNEEIRVLNQYLEPAAPHVLYNFVKQANVAPPVVTTKSVLQKNAVSAMQTTFAFNETNFQLWLRNGIMRSNTRQDIPPISPEQTIELMRRGAQEGVGIDPATIALIIGISKALIAAIGATTALLASIKAAKQAKIMQAAEGLGNKSFGPEKSDWPGGGSGDDSTEDTTKGVDASKYILPLAIGAAAFLILD